MGWAIAGKRIDMTTTATTAAVPESHGVANALWRRQLYKYPNTLPRIGYLAIVVLTTIMLYYLYYVEGAVTPLLLPYYHMSFQFFLYLLVVSNAIGAFSAFIGGLSDKIGRANLTIYGTLLVALIQLFAIPHISDKWGFAACYCVIGFVEGIILVSTPALMRDFSPQMGRGVAMGFWALGPTMGALCASVVATHTLAHLAPWQDQFLISGIVCLCVVAISFVFLRELSPQLRDQLMVTERERALVESRAMGIDIEGAIAHPLRTMLRLDLITSSFAISVFLLFYYASVSVLTIYWVVTYNRTTPQANGINVWLAAFLSLGLVVAGLLSDWAKVRKPFMLFGAICAMVMMVFLIEQTDHPHTGYYSNVLVIVLLAVSISIAYAPWMANYTEQVEHHNPALTATGLAIWGWILRIVVALSFLVLPYVITTSTTLVDNQNAGSTLQAIQAAQPYAPNTATLKCNATPAPADVIANLKTTPEARPELDTLATILQVCNSSHDLIKALTAAGGITNAHVLGLNAFNPLALDVQHGRAVTPAQIAGVAKYSPNLANLLVAEQKLVPAQKTSPGEWKRWWTVCLIGQFVFAILVFTMRGRWSPRAARRDLDAHDRMVSEELAKLAAEQPAAVS
jgi:MFS family permease